MQVLERLLEDSSLNFAAKNQDGNIPLHYFVLASKWGSDVERYEKLLDRMLAGSFAHDEMPVQFIVSLRAKQRATSTMQTSMAKRRCIAV